MHTASARAGRDSRGPLAPVQHEADDALGMYPVYSENGRSWPHKVENFKGQYMIFTYENRHQASFKGCFSAFSNFAHTPLYRLFVLGGRETIAHAKTCLGLLVCVADSHLQLLSAIRYTDSYRNYSINKMDFTSMSAYGSLAGHRNFFLHWAANL